MDKTILLFGFEFPDYVFFLIGIAISVGIYFSFDDEKRHKANLFLKEWGIWILIFFSWLFFRNRLGYFDYGTFWNNRANTAAILISLVYGIFIFVRFKQRYKSTHLIADNISGSCASYEYCQDFVICNLETTDEGWIPQVHGERTLVVPARHFHKINGKENSAKSQIWVETKVMKSDIEEVPQYVYDTIMGNPLKGITGNKHYNWDNVYLGYFSAAELENKDLKLKDNENISLDPAHWEARMKDTNRMLNDSRIMLKEKLSNGKTIISDLGAIYKKGRGKDAYRVDSSENNPNG